ncbi:MAG: FAD-dependent oxidoreductase [Actinomycetota bacterium]|nr:FAD-dependent oxidoreductase [Actinomycetota bacterium]
MTERLVIIGGDAAGMSAASQARRLRGPQELSIVAFDQGNYLSYSACGIPYFVGGVVDELDKLVVRTPEQFASKQDIDARIRHQVTELDLDKGAVKVTDVDEGTETWEGFDQLLVATGATPKRPPLPHADADGIFGVQVLDDGRAIFETMRARRPRKVAVVGAGYIGLEMAEAFKMRGLEVTVVEASSHPMPSLDDDIAASIADAMGGMGIAWHSSERVDAFEVKDGWVSGVVTSKRTIPTDIVVLGLGVAPNVEVAEAAGVPIGPSGAIAVDRRMRTEVEGVWAAGDCAEKFHRVSRRPVTIALGTHANKEGRVAGINLGGGYASFPGVIGTAVSKLCDTEVGRTGLNEDEAGAAGFSFITATVDSTTRAGYYPETQPIKTKLLAERGSGRLLGAQIVGKEGAAKRIDVLATAIWNEMSVDELLNIDLSYAPPFSPVWDPVLIAARKAWQLIEQSAKRP